MKRFVMRRHVYHTWFKQALRHRSRAHITRNDPPGPLGHEFTCKCVCRGVVHAPVLGCLCAETCALLVLRRLQSPRTQALSGMSAIHMILGVCGYLTCFIWPSASLVLGPGTRAMSKPPFWGACGAAALADVKRKVRYYDESNLQIKAVLLIPFLCSSDIKNLKRAGGSQSVGQVHGTAYI